MRHPIDQVARSAKTVEVEARPELCRSAAGKIERNRPIRQRCDRSNSVEIGLSETAGQRDELNHTDTKEHFPAHNILLTKQYCLAVKNVIALKGLFF